MTHVLGPLLVENLFLLLLTVSILLATKKYLRRNLYFRSFYYLILNRMQYQNDHFLKQLKTGNENNKNHQLGYILTTDEILRTNVVRIIYSYR